MNALLSRRSFLLAGLAAGAVAGAAAGAHLPPAALGFQVLSAEEARVVEAVAAALFPAGHFPVVGGDGGTAPALDLLLADYMDPATVEPFRYLLRTLEIGTLVSRGVPFSRLPLDAATEVLEVWSADDPVPRRLAHDSLRTLVGMAFLRRPEVVGAIGWRAGCAT